MSWAHILGHDALIESFTRVVRRNRLAHAYLFCGAEGVGKRIFARELAKALLCEANQSPERLAACDACPSCRLMDAGNHPDSRSVFILIGTSLDRQLPTIQSRCQIVRFRPLPRAAVEQILRQHDVTDAAAIRRLVRLSSGSPGQALALADPALWECRSRLLEGLSLPRVDSVGLAKRFVEFVEDAGKEMALQRRRASLVLGLLITAFRDSLALNQGNTEPRPLGSESVDDDRILKALASRADTEKLLALIERCLEAEQHLGRYVQVVLVLEALLDAMSQKLEEGAAALANR
jgi:DNA polymerase-3 subunit delta'